MTPFPVDNAMPSLSKSGSESVNEITLDRLPKFILVDLSRTFFILDRLAQNEKLPTIDVEALMSQIVDCFCQPPQTKTQWQACLDEMTQDVFRVAEPQDFEFNYVMVRGQLFNALTRTDMQLNQAKLYVFNRLPYDYVQRKHSGSALLRRCQDSRLWVSNRIAGA